MLQPAIRAKLRNAFFRLMQSTVTPDYSRSTLRDCIGRNGVDAQTHWDLDLDDFTEAFDQTGTSFGKEMFDHLLHFQPDSHHAAAHMAADARRLLEQPHAFQKLTKELARVGRQGRGRLIQDIWDGLQYRSHVIDYIPVYATLNLLQLLLIFFLAPQFIIPALLLFLSAGVLMHSLTSPSIRSLAGSFQYFLHGQRFLKRNRSLISRLFPERAIPYSKSLQGLSRYSLFFADSGNNSATGDILAIIVDYLRIFFSMEARAYRACRKTVNQHIASLRDIITCIGTIDCIMNTARLMSDYSAGAVVWNEDTQNPRACPGERSRISAAALRHPLVPDCLPQNCDIGRNIIITGMNMSGKSTFLKSLALNQLCAQAFGIAFAESFRTSVLKVISSLKLVDDIENKKSKYYVEAERLLLIQKELGTQPCLCLIDEILTGTNNDERVTASIGLLRNFAARTESVIIAATHDTHIAQELSQLYDQFYFDGEIEGERIAFDYRLKPGIVSRRNGLLLLQFLGLDI